MKDKSILDMAERLLLRKLTQGEMDRLSALPSIEDVHLFCNDILTKEDRLSNADYKADYLRAGRMMINLSTDDINLIVDVIEGRRVEAFIRAFAAGGCEIRPVSSMPVFIQDMVAAGVDVELIKEGFSRAIAGHLPDSYRSPAYMIGGRRPEAFPYRSQGSTKMAFLQDMLESKNVGMVEIEAAFEQAKEEYRKTIEDDG